MEQQNLSKEIQQMGQVLKDFQDQLEELSAHWDETVMRMQDLRTENVYLRERLQQLTAEQESRQDRQQEENDEEMTPALKNLLAIYEEGFHICNISYGQRREDDEPCMFCLEILYGDRRKNA